MYFNDFKMASLFYSYPTMKFYAIEKNTLYTRALCICIYNIWQISLRIRRRLAAYLILNKNTFALTTFTNPSSMSLALRIHRFYLFIVFRLQFLLSSYPCNNFSSPYWATCQRLRLQSKERKRKRKNSKEEIKKGQHKVSNVAYEMCSQWNLLGILINFSSSWKFPDEGNKNTNFHIDKMANVVA